MLGFGVALLLESLDTNLKTMTDIEQALQMPLLAAIPAVEEDELIPSTFREAAVSKGASSWSRIPESLRGLRTSILLSSPGVLRGAWSRDATGGGKSHRNIDGNHHGPQWCASPVD